MLLNISEAGISPCRFVVNQRFCSIKKYINKNNNKYINFFLIIIFASYVNNLLADVTAVNKIIYQYAPIGIIDFAGNDPFVIPLNRLKGCSANILGDGPPTFNVPAEGKLTASRRGIPGGPFYVSIDNADKSNKYIVFNYLDANSRNIGFFDGVVLLKINNVLVIDMDDIYVNQLLSVATPKVHFITTLELYDQLDWSKIYSVYSVNYDPLFPTFLLFSFGGLRGPLRAITVSNEPSWIKIPSAELLRPDKSFIPGVFITHINDVPLFTYKHLQDDLYYFRHIVISSVRFVQTAEIWTLQKTEYLNSNEFKESLLQRKLIAEKSKLKSKSEQAKKKTALLRARNRRQSRPKKRTALLRASRGYLSRIKQGIKEMLVLLPLLLL